MGVLGSYLFSALLIDVYRKSVRRDETDVHAKRRKDKREKLVMVKMSKGFRAWGGILLILWILFVLCLVAQWCPTLCELWNVSPPGSYVHEILQARILEWIAMPSSRGFSQPRDWTQVSHITGRFFTIWATREALCILFIAQLFILYSSRKLFLLNAHLDIDYKFWFKSSRQCKLK